MHTSRKSPDRPRAPTRHFQRLRGQAPALLDFSVEPSEQSDKAVDELPLVVSDHAANSTLAQAEEIPPPSKRARFAATDGANKSPQSSDHRAKTGPCKRCPTCKIHLHGPNTNDHPNAHNEDPKKTFSCAICGIFMQKPSGRNLHEKVQHGFIRHEVDVNLKAVVKIRKAQLAQLFNVGSKLVVIQRTAVLSRHPQADDYASENELQAIVDAGHSGKKCPCRNNDGMSRAAALEPPEARDGLAAGGAHLVELPLEDAAIPQPAILQAERVLTAERDLLLKDVPAAESLPTAPAAFQRPQAEASRVPQDEHGGSEVDVRDSTSCAEQTERPGPFRLASVVRSVGDRVENASMDTGAQSESGTSLCNSRVSTASVALPLASEECVRYTDEFQKLFGDTILDTLKLAFAPANAEATLGQCGSISIKQTDLRTLTNNRWLNDTIISAYLELIVERSRRKGLERIYAFSTFFYVQMLERGYEGVKRWFRKVNLFQHEILLVPIHHEKHWSMVVVAMNRQIFFYYDSLQFEDQEQAETFTWKYVKSVKKMIEEEAKQKLKIADYCKDFLTVCVNSPVQENTVDCGVFACCYADAFCRRETPLTFRQNQMPLYRLQMMAEIVCGFLFEPPRAPPSEVVSDPKPTSAEATLEGELNQNGVIGNKDKRPQLGKVAHNRL